MTKARLRILETTDLHMNLTGFHYLTGQTTLHSGLSNLAPLIAHARDQVDETLLFDNGDFLQGNPLADHLAATNDTTTAHPMIAAMNDLRYDAVALGNHEFDYGLDYLTRVLTDAQMPVVCANLRTDRQRTLYPPWTLLTRDMRCEDGQIQVLRIGVVGFVTPQIVDWDAHLLQGRVMTDDIVAAARTYLPQIRRAGADIIVALCHSGISGRAAFDRMENAALPLAALPGIDVVLTGHTHDLFPSPLFDGIDGIDTARAKLHGKPAVMAGSYGGALGIVDLDLSFSPDGWSIDDHRVTIRHPNGDTPDDPVASTIFDNIAAPQSQTLAKMRKPVGTTPRRLTSYLAAVGHDDTAAFLADAQINATRAALADTDYADLPVLAATATFRAGGHRGPANYFDRDAGQLTQGDLAAIAPFDNPVCGVLRRGWQLRQWLERSSAYYATIPTDHARHALVVPHVAPYHFDTIHGLRYRIDLRVPPRTEDQNETAASRVRDVSYDGQLLKDDALFVVTTSSYRAFGGGGLVKADPQDVIYTSPVGMSAVVRDYLRDHTIPATAPPCPWQFMPCKGAIMTFHTAPAATGVLAGTASDLNLEPRDLRDDGFQNFALHL